MQKLMNTYLDCCVLNLLLQTEHQIKAITPANSHITRLGNNNFYTCLRLLRLFWIYTISFIIYFQRIIIKNIFMKKYRQNRDCSWKNHNYVKMVHQRQKDILQHNRKNTITEAWNISFLNSHLSHELVMWPIYLSPLALKFVHYKLNHWTIHFSFLSSFCNKLFSLVQM